MTLLIVLAGLLAYFGIGFGYVAPRWVTREVSGFVRRCPNLAEDPARVDEERREAAGFAIGIAFIWPFYLAGRLVTTWISGASPLTDYELKAKTEQQAKRIAELERELGIGTERA